MKNQNKVFLVLIIIGFSVFLILPNIPNSYAHALIVKSNPAPSQSLPSPPSKVDVYFTDPVDIQYSTIKVLDPNGNEVQNKDLKYLTSDQTALTVSLPPGLPNGVYTVSTKVLDQTDGHVTENGFVFAVGVAAPPTTSQPKVSYSDVISIPDAIARFPALIGQVMAVGAAFSTLWLWSPISKITLLQQQFAKTRLAIDKRTTLLILISSAIVFASGFGMISSVAYSIHAGFLDAVSTKFGHMWVVRMIASSALLGLAVVFYFSQKKSNSILPKWQTATIFGVGIIVLSTTSIISHGAATGQISPLILDFVHNLAASLWIGGIIYIDYVMISKLKQLSDDNIASSILSIIIPRFSTIVLLILAIITISGPFLLFLLESNLALTLVSIYGKILIVKLSLAAIMIGIGAYHQFEVHKHALRDVTVTNTRSAVIQTRSTKSKLLSKFGLSAKIESIAGILLVASVAVLVDSGLPATEYQDILQTQQPTAAAFGINPNNTQNVFTDTQFVENGSRVVLTIDPYFVGSNTINMTFLDANRNPIDIQSVLLELTQTDKSIGPIKVNATQVYPGTYSVQTNSLTIPGNWQAHVEGVPTAAGSLSLVADFNLNVKPNVHQISANIQEYKLPDNKTLPLYPVYDKKRNAVWVGDTAIKSERMWKFDLNSKNYTEYKINGTNIITYAVLDDQDSLWYVDPISKIIGHFNPSDKSNKIYRVPTNGSLAGLAQDNSGNLWLTVSTADELIKFNPQANNFTFIKLPTGSEPLGIAIDGSSNQIWIAESGTGKIATVDPKNYTISEYPLAQENYTLSSPTVVLIDPSTGKVFVSEHDGAAVSIFDPLLKTFTRYQLDSQGLPFGMAFDGNHDLWIAQHTLDKIIVVDPRTGETNEFDIPVSSSFTQWVTTGSEGNIIMAEQRASALGIITTTTTPVSSQESSQMPVSPIPQLGFGYTDVAAPSIIAGLIAVAFFFSRSTLELKKSLRYVTKIYKL
jgi:copper transport protein